MLHAITVWSRSLCGAGIVLAAALAIDLGAPPAAASPAYEQRDDGLLMTYRRLLPLEGGSNFRDLGGYTTGDGRTVKRGLLFRSGAMTSLTAADQVYLQQFDFSTVVDLRSSEELELLPNRWVENAGIDYLVHDYRIGDMMANLVDEQGERQPMEVLYEHFHKQLQPQLRLFFDALLKERTPLVVNCSAGQDRTGVTSALLLTALGVPREAVLEDYLLSTDFRRPAAEMGDVDLVAASRDNAFAKLMLAYNSEEGGARKRLKPLVTGTGVPYVEFTLARIEADYGSVASWLEQEVGIDSAELARLRELYLL